MADRASLISERSRLEREWTQQPVSLSQFPWNVPFSDVPHSVRRTLYVRLESDTGISGLGYALLAEKIGIHPEEISRLRHIQQPTEGVIERYCQMRDSTLGRMVHMLSDLGRDDAVKILKKYGEELKAQPPRRPPQSQHCQTSGAGYSSFPASTSHNHQVYHHSHPSAGDRYPPPGPYSSGHQSGCSTCGNMPSARHEDDNMDWEESRDMVEQHVPFLQGFGRTNLGVGSVSDTMPGDNDRMIPMHPGVDPSVHGRGHAGYYDSSHDQYPLDLSSRGGPQMPLKTDDFCNDYRHQCIVSDVKPEPGDFAPCKHSGSASVKHEPNPSFDAVMDDTPIKEEQKLSIDSGTDSFRSFGSSLYSADFSLSSFSSTNTDSGSFPSGETPKSTGTSPHTLPRRSRKEKDAVSEALSATGSHEEPLEKIPYAPGERAVRVFLTYSCDSHSHMKRVLDLHDCLTKNKFSVTLDVIDKNRSLVPQAEAMQVLETRYEKANFILVCISPKYHADVTASDNPLYVHGDEVVLNARRIFALMQQELREKNKRIIPLIFTQSKATKEHLPLLLKNLFRYKWPDQYKHLFFHLMEPEKVLKKLMDSRYRHATKHIDNFPTAK